MEEKLIDAAVTNPLPHYEPYGWQQWPEEPWMSYQFRRGLGESQEGGGAVSECFQTASRITPGDEESWHREWLDVAERNRRRGEAAEAAGHLQTAQNCFLRAANYYRQAEFMLGGHDPRRLQTFEKMEACSKSFLRHLAPAGESVDIPYEGGVSMCGYFIRAPYDVPRQPVLICIGGLDSIKDELWFIQARGALQRGISVLMIDGPGQGGTLRRHGITTRYDYEVPVGRCIDWLIGRSDVDPSRIAVCGSSLGGFYAARAGSCEPRLAACVTHGAIWDLPDLWTGAGEDHGLASHIKWVFGTDTMQEAKLKAHNFRLDGVLDKMKCPFLVVHGGFDVLGVTQARTLSDYARTHGVDVTVRFLDADETGADHCQHDNPTIGQEIIGDWLADRFGIDEQALRRTITRALI